MKEENLEKVVSGDRNFNMYIPELSVSFTSELKSISPDKKVKIFIPHEFSFFERNGVSQFMTFFAETVSQRTAAGQRQSVEEGNYIVTLKLDNKTVTITKVATLDEANTLSENFIKEGNGDTRMLLNENV